MSKNMMVLMRGLSGSGKTHTAHELARTAGCDPASCIFSAADFLDDTSTERHSTPHIEASHADNMRRICGAIADRIQLVIVDNTNTRLWEMVEYIDLAKMCGYGVRIAHSRAEWRFDPVECARRCLHHSDEEITKRQLSKWEYWSPKNVEGLHHLIVSARHHRDYRDESPVLLNYPR